MPGPWTRYGGMPQLQVEEAELRAFKPWCTWTIVHAPPSSAAWSALHCTPASPGSLASCLEHVVRQFKGLRALSAVTALNHWALGQLPLSSPLPTVGLVLSV